MGGAGMACIKTIEPDEADGELSSRQKALCKLAVLLTHTPAAVRRRNLETLRKHGLTDRDILDAVQVISYFNYVNRFADALGIDLEPEMRQAFRRWRRKARQGR